MKDDSKDESPKDNSKPTEAGNTDGSAAASAENAAESKGEIAPSEATPATAEGSYALGASAPQEQVIEQAVVEEERWYHKVFAFLSTSAHAIIGFCLFAIAGFFFYQVLIFDLPEYGNEWFVFATTLHPFMLQIPIGVLVYLIFVEFCRRFQWFQPRKRKLPRVPALIVLAFSACISAGLNYFEGTSGQYIGNDFHTRYLLADLLFAALTGLALAFGAMIVYNKNEFSKLGYLLILLAMTGMGFISGHMGGALRHGEQLYLEKAPASVQPVLKRAFGIAALEEQSADDGEAADEGLEATEEGEASEVEAADDDEAEAEDGEALSPADQELLRAIEEALPGYEIGGSELPFVFPDSYVPEEEGQGDEIVEGDDASMPEGAEDLFNLADEEETSEESSENETTELESEATEPEGDAVETEGEEVTEADVE